jgi:nitrogen PTS system EIIA component
LKSMLKPELAFAKQPIVSKKRVLETIAGAISDRLHCDGEDVYDALLSREKLGSTGIGLGIAVPHCRLESANQAAILIMSLETPIDFDAVDRKPVDLLFALIVPPHECDHHLATLAQIAGLAQSQQALNALRAATTNEELYAAFEALV